jgi:sugar O-acyltransferase (sialic acid O-acetyltransferase NeuD family)
MMDRLVIFGCGGHAKSVADVALYNEPSLKLVLVDENAEEEETVLGFPVMTEYSVKPNDKVFVAIGDNERRKNMCEKYYDNLISIVSKRAYTGREVSIEQGVFVAHDAHIGVFSKINDFAVINTKASLDHECEIGIAATISPGAILCGKVVVGDMVWIGANATVRVKICIIPPPPPPTHTQYNLKIRVGMGAVVDKDIRSYGIYAGVPARQLCVKSESYLSGLPNENCISGQKRICRQNVILDCD